MYSQDIGPCGPLEGSVVHLLQVCVSLQLPVGKDSVLSGVCTSCVTCHSCVHPCLGLPVPGAQGSRVQGEMGEKHANLGKTVKLCV